MSATLVDANVLIDVLTEDERIEDLDEALPSRDYRRAELPWAAGFLAAKAFVRYRRAGGIRRAPLPDFYIGAHAAIAGLTLLTRDAKRYRTYFPGVRLIAP
jgi:predicted nucleic acid-binding protein